MIIVLKEPDFEKYVDGTAEVHEIKMVHHGIKEIVVEDDETQGKTFFDDDDDDYLDDQDEVIQRVATISTYFLICSTVTGEFEWVDDLSCISQDSSAGKTLCKKYQKRKRRLKRTKIIVEIASKNS